MEEAAKQFLELLSKLQKQAQEKTDLTHPELQVASVQNASKKAKRQYIISHTDNYEARVKKAQRATELRHLLNRLKTLESSIEGMNKFLEDKKDPNYSFGGQFDPMIHKVQLEADRVKQRLSQFASEFSKPPVSIEPTVSTPTETGPTEKATEENTEDPEPTDEFAPEAHFPIGSKIEPEETLPAGNTPSPSPPPEASLKRKRLSFGEDEEVDADKKKSDVFFNPDAGVIHQNSPVPAFGAPVGRVGGSLTSPSPASAPIPIQVRAQPKPTDFASFFRDHLRR